MKWTVHDYREREIQNLATMIHNPSTDESIAEARRLMNSMYRLCGLCEKNLYLANDERTCDLHSTHASEDREFKWCKRLNNQFAKYGLKLNYFGYHPTIVYADEKRLNSEAISLYFYD